MIEGNEGRHTAGTERQIAFIRVGAGMLTLLQATVLSVSPVSRPLAYALAAGLILTGAASAAAAPALRPAGLQRLGAANLILDMAAASLALFLFSNYGLSAAWVTFMLVAVEAASRYAVRGALAVTLLFAAVDPPVQYHAHQAFGLALEPANVTMRVGMVSLMAFLMAFLASQRDRSRIELETQLRQLRVAARMSAAVRWAPNPEDVLGEVLQILREALNADGAMAARLDEINQRLVVLRPILFGEAEPGGTFPVEGTLQGRVVRERRALRTDDSDSDPRASERAREFRVRAAVCVPMEIEGRVLGTLTLMRHSPRPFNDSDERLLALAADQAAILIENARLYEETQRLAATDELTGLLNRRAFLDRLAGEAARAARYREPFALLSLDMDQLKAINDEGGHAAGDRALRLLAGVLSTEVRTTDTVARMGGDEFVVLMPVTGTLEARLSAERFCAAFASAAQADTGPVASISVGGVIAEGGIPDALLEEADRRLYRAKRLGRDTVVIEELPRPD